MVAAALWGAVGASSLLIGALLGLVLPLSRRTTGLVLAFGAGTLISAVAFELTAEAYSLGGADRDGRRCSGVLHRGLSGRTARRG